MSLVLSISNIVDSIGPKCFRDGLPLGFVRLAAVAHNSGTLASPDMAVPQR